MESDKENVPEPFSDMMTQALLSTKVPHFCNSSQPIQCLETFDSSCKSVELETDFGIISQFSAAIHLLYYIPYFRQAILDFNTPSQSTEACKVILSLQELFKNIIQSEEKLLNPALVAQSVRRLFGQRLETDVSRQCLDLLLSRMVEDACRTMVEQLFVGSLASRNYEGASSNDNNFTHHTLQLTHDTSFHVALTAMLSSDYLNDVEPERSKHFFTRLPPVYLLDVCRMENHGTHPGECIKVNYNMSFPSLFFMDRFIMENAEQVTALSVILGDLQAIKARTQLKLRSLAPLLQNVPQLKTEYQNYQRAVDHSTVNFDLLCSLNHEWELEIQSKMHQLYRQSHELEREIEEIQSRNFSTCRPYQLLGVVVHREGANGGHYFAFVWDIDHRAWFQIDDTVIQQVTWDIVICAAFGGVEQDSSARSLVYVDALQSGMLLRTKTDYVIGPTDVLRYLKDNTDVRTRHAAYGRSQTLKAVLSLTALGLSAMDGSKLLYYSLNNERQRLYALSREWMSHSGQSVENESRLLHFGVYLLANRVEFEPYLYWTLLQHFAALNQFPEQETNSICTAARHALAFMDNSTTQEQKKIFIQWNTAFYQFRLIVRHVMNGVTHVFSRNFSAALPLAVKALYLHHGLTKNSLNGPAMSIRPSVIHSLIDKAVTSLSDELLESDLESVSDLACTVLFNSIVNWCEYSDKDNLEAARCSSRLIADRWSHRIKEHIAILGAAECATSSGLRMLAEIQRKLHKVESVLSQPDENGNPTPFDFKGHIPENPDDGEKLAAKWKQLWLIVLEQRILNH